MNSPPEGRMSRERLGFRDGQRGLHSSRTMMWGDLSQLMAHATAGMSVPEYRRLVVEENVLGKPTRMTREHTIRKLKAMYGLEPTIPIFRNMLRLWPADPNSRPLLALLCAHARDPLLRIASDAVVKTPRGQLVTPESVLTVVEAKAVGRFSSTNLRAIAVRVLGTFTQSGHLSGNLTKTRQLVLASPVNAAYAAFVAHLDGFTAQRLLSSPWAALLDVSPGQMTEFLRAAGQRGILGFRQVGDVLDVSFDDWLTREEKELVRG